MYSVNKLCPYVYMYSVKYLNMYSVHNVKAHKSRKLDLVSNSTLYLDYELIHEFWRAIHSNTDV